nr:TolC family outer membrane protein [uncultured Desulfobulbus sp.]
MTLQQSVAAALETSPQLRSLQYGRDAARFELKQSRGRYYPSIDVLLGYGPNQYNDRATRLNGADPGNEDWMLKTDATLRLTQQLYDGGETAHFISAHKAGLETAELSLQEGAQSTIFDTVRAHLGVIREQQIVTLDLKNLEIHQEIHKALTALIQAGAGDVADRSQVRARIAWAESNVTSSRRGLEQAIAQYRRLVGQSPGQLVFDGPPKGVPDSLSEALRLAEQKNPTLLISSSKVDESEAQVRLAESRYLPRVNLELSSSYNDNIEGDDSWRQSHEAMIVLRWNVFNGGQDQSAVNAAVARSYESRLSRTDNLEALHETVRTAWTAFVALSREVKIYQEATLAAKQTLLAYMEQFSVARRSLLDVLNAEREFVQSAQKAVSAQVDRVIAAYYLVQLKGTLKLDQVVINTQSRREFEALIQSMNFPPVRGILVPGQMVAPVSPLNIVHIRGLVIEAGAMVHANKERYELHHSIVQIRAPIIASRMENFTLKGWDAL